MKIKYTFFLLLISSLALAQSNDNKYEILYNFIYQKDSTDVYSVEGEEMILFTDGENSLFQSYLLYQRDSLIQKDFDNGEGSSASMITKALGYPKPSQMDKLNKDFRKQKYTQKRRIGKEYYSYQEDFDLKWKIYNDSIKDYHGMKTILATTRMGGRDYKVWFNPNIPIPDGPYKFQGLPGLVVHAIDSDGYFEFNLKAIRKVTKFHYNDYNPFERTIVKSTKEDYKKAKKYYDDNKYEIYKQRGITFPNEDELKAKYKKKRARNNNHLERE